MDGLDIPITIDIPTYGAVAFGLGRNASYEAANSGAFATVEVQGKKKVPWRAELKKLAGDDPSVLQAMTDDFLNKLRKLQAKAA